MTIDFAELRRGSIWVLVVACAALLIGCGGQDEVATDRDAVPTVTPGSNDELPADIESAKVTITGGVFDVDELTLSQGQPTDLTVVNHDNDAYTLEIESLVAGTPIEAEATTEIGFTTPAAGKYTARLIALDGTIVDELSVVVLAPDGATT